MPGKFIVIEGSDGSGKSTQFALLQKKLVDIKFKVHPLHFPRYGKPAAYFEEQYLRGRYGSGDEVGPYKGSLFYAMDRFDAAHDIKRIVREGGIVLSDRYIGSNMAHQGGKIKDSLERERYFDWVNEIEYDILQISQPDVNIVLQMPAHIAAELIKQRADGSTSPGIKADIHETDLNHLENSVRVYDELCKLYAEMFTSVDSMAGEKLLSIETIHNKIWSIIEPLLNTIS